MNFRQKFFERNKIIQLMKYNSRVGSRCNFFYYNPNNSNEHEDIKYKIYKELRDKGYDVWVEVEFSGGGKADILTFNPSTGGSLIVEVMYSETLEKAKIKTQKYPNIDKVYISTDAPIEKGILSI